jgi:hypothetical protein
MAQKRGFGFSLGGNSFNCLYIVWENDDNVKGLTASAVCQVSTSFILLPLICLYSFCSSQALMHKVKPSEELCLTLG